MAKKKTVKKTSASRAAKSSTWKPNSLEDPVHNVVGYVVLLVLALVVFWLVWTLTGH